jgi:hypothetical protein
VSIKLNSPEDFNRLPVLDDVADFDSGKVQTAEHWLIENVLPPAEIQLPESWRIAGNTATGFYFMSYNQISEANIVTYRADFAFFVMREGKKMLRLGVEFGGPGQLMNFNLEDPRWWTDPEWQRALILGFNRSGKAFERILPTVSFGTEPAFAPEIYTRKVYQERDHGGNQFFLDWIKNRQLPDGADRTVFGMSTG